MMYEHDLIVVGGGPAGSTLSLYAARQGLDVLMLDKKRFPRDKVCGDALPVPGLRVLQELGLRAAVDELPQGRATIVFFTEAERLEPPKVAGGSPVIRRKLLDETLFRAAANEVEAREGFRVQGLLQHDDGQCYGVRGVDADGTAREITAKVVVAADGAASTVAIQAGMRPPEARDGAVATRSYVRGLPMTGNEFEIYYLDACNPGYFWIFPVDDGVANVGVLLFGRTRVGREISVKDLHRQIVASPLFASRFAVAEEVDTLRKWYLPMAGGRLTLHGNGILLVGDAAGLIDPLLGHGIDSAMISSRIAAKVLGSVCAGDDYSAEALAPYTAYVHRHLGPAIRASERLRSDLAGEKSVRDQSERMTLLNDFYFRGTGVRGPLERATFVESTAR